MTKGHSLVHHQPFELIEHVGVSGIDSIGSKHLAWSDDPQGRRGVFHHPNLHRRRLTAHQQIIFEVEVFRRIAGDVIDRDIEPGEVMPLVLDLWTIRYLES